MKSPPKETRGVQTALKTAELLATYRLLAFLQPFSGGRVASRRCVSCDSRLTNRNLGGYDGRSALSGPLWCYHCANLPKQLMLPLSGLKAIRPFL